MKQYYLISGNKFKQVARVYVIDRLICIITAKNLRHIKTDVYRYAAILSLPSMVPLPEIQLGKLMMSICLVNKGKFCYVPKYI